MLSDEEKKAIERAEFLIKIDTYLEKEMLTNLLNLIEKQQKEIEELNKSDSSKEQSSMNYYNLYKELVDKIKAKIEELERRIDYLDKELAEAYIMREKLGTETEIDTNEQYIYNMEQERSIRHTQKIVLQSLLEKE